MGKRSKKNSTTSSMAGKTPNSNPLEEEQPNLNLPMINQRFAKSESSQKDLTSRVGRIEEQLTETNQTLSKLTKMMEVMLAGNNVEMGENSNSARPPRRNQDQVPTIPEEILEEARPVRGVRSLEQQPQNQRVVLPFPDFPIFNGENPTEWLEECDYYFEVFQTPEIYKVQMATMNFTGDAREWYETYTIAKPAPPWLILTEEVMNFFARSSGKPIDEFKGVQQQGRVEEYIKSFLRVKSRLMYKTRIDNEEFYLGIFISGLRDELRNTIDLLKPSTLDEAFQIARQIEVSFETNSKRVNSLSNRSQICYENQELNKNWREATNNSAKNSVDAQSTLSLEQKRAKGLCYKCGEKYFQGQKCSNQNYPKRKAMEFEGYIGAIPIIALMVSGSTHSFLKPTIAQKLKLQVTRTKPLILQTANGTRVQTNSLCRSQKFQLQEHEFEANLRLLEIPDYDMILGSDWLAQVGTMCMDLGNGIVKMKHKGKNIQLVIGKKLAEIKLCEQEPEIVHLFCMEEVKS